MTQVKIRLYHRDFKVIQKMQFYKTSLQDTFVIIVTMARSKGVTTLLVCQLQADLKNFFFLNFLQHYLHFNQNPILTIGSIKK